MNILSWERLLGVSFYLIPWSDAFPLGENLFYSFPFLLNLSFTTYPIIFIENILPFGLGNIFIFSILFFGIVRNSKMSYFLRFHALQAILINLLIIIAIYFYQIIVNAGIHQTISETYTGLIFLGAFIVIMFSLIKCLQGQEAEIPLISEAVRMQL